MKPLATTILFLVAFTMFVMSVTTAWAASTETFVPTTIHYPGSTSTAARGINNSGDIVGTYVCATACINPLTGEASTPGQHGFLLQDGVYTRIDVPGGINIVARAISEQGVVLGHYDIGTGSAAVTHGFTYFQGNYFYPIDVPAELFDNPFAPVRNTFAVRISPQGDIVGTFQEDNQHLTTGHGWLLRNGTFTVLLTPHSPGDTTSRDPDTSNTGIAPTGEIVGFYSSAGVSYIANKQGIVTTFTFPGNLFTRAWDVNPKGDIVGVRGDNQANTVGSPVPPHGFIRTKEGEYRTLSVLNATSTQVFGINSIRDIVGAYADATGTHGFVYRVRR
jgi:uncharacterized membrane protein